MKTYLIDSGRKTSWLALFFISIIYFFANLQKVIIPGATFDELQQLFSLDASAVTRMGAVFLGVYAAAQLFVGVLADRFGGARVIFAGGFLFCLGSLMSALEFSVMLLYFSRFLTGMGAAAIYLSMVKEIGRIAPSILPMLIGVATIIGYSGSIVGASPFIAGVDKFGYQPMVMLAGISAALFYTGYVFTALKTPLPPVKKEVRFSIASFLQVFKSPQNRSLIIAIGISFGTYFAMQSTLTKKFLEDFCKMSNNASGAVATVTMIIAAFNGFIMANISQLLKKRRRIIMIFSGVGCFTGAVAILLGVLLGRGAFLPVTGIIIMALAGNVSPIFVALLKESNPENCFGTVICVGNFFAYAVSAAFSGCAGKLMDVYQPQIVDGVKVYGQQSYLLVFSAFALVGLISALLALKVKESYGKDISALFYRN
ncbi:MAG: multidrug effflux MFS transporter [Lentisphaerae bacterium]|nr:multidrug effflux MFS transporter [Lentisphaerota bacterium]